MLLAAARAEIPENGLSALFVPLDRPSPKLEAAKRTIQTALAGIPVKPGQKPKFLVTTSGQGVVWGDLFKTGACFALVELASQNDPESRAKGAAYAEWVDGGWVLLGVWDIPVIWRPEGWQESEGDYLPAAPATQPFALEDFSGDGVPEVVMAGGVFKYFQENYLLRFRSGTKELKLVGYAMAKPEKAGDFVRLYSDSGRRSIWTEWSFCKWEGDNLISVASWRSEVGYGENDPTFSEGTRVGADGQSVTIRVLYGHGQEIDGDHYEISRNGLPFGTMQIVWKDRKHGPVDTSGVEEAWLFEKITGLPRSLLPGRENPGPLPKLEDFAAVIISGNDEAAGFFGKGKHPSSGF